MNKNNAYITKTERCDGSDEKMKERERGTHSQEIELALIHLQEAILRIGKNINALISEVTGDPPENYLEDEKTDEDRGKEYVQIPLLVLLQTAPNQLRSLSQRLMEIDKRVEYLRGILDGSL